MSVGNYCSCQRYTTLRFEFGEDMGRQLHLYSDKESLLLLLLLFNMFIKIIHVPKVGTKKQFVVTFSSNFEFVNNFKKR
jgi:hypothetical protein